MLTQRPNAVHDRATPIGWIVSLALLVALTASAKAHNGSQIIALPVQGIIVDGDLSDWPSDLPKHPLRYHRHGDAPADGNDLSAWFQVGYDLDLRRVFVALEVRDTSLVLARSESAPRRLSRDGAEIYFDQAHTSTVGDAAGVCGQEAIVPSKQVSVAFSHEPATRRYEWSYDLATDDEALREPFTAAFCVEVVDVDEDGSVSILSWSPSNRIGSGPTVAGDLILGVRREQIGTITGSLHEDAKGNRFGRTLVRYTSQSMPRMVVDVMSDEGGNFTVQVPAGSYERSLRDWPDQPHRSEVSVSAKSETTDSIAVQVNDSGIESLGAGQTYPMRASITGTLPNDQQPGTMFEVRRYAPDAESVPHGQNYDVVVDQLGYKWVANANGLVRLGGGEAVLFSREDGIPGTSVHALLLADREHLWIGTDRGVARVSTLNRSLKILTELAGKRVYRISPLHDGRIAAATDRGLFAWDTSGTAVSVIPSGRHDSRCLAICADPSGRFTWVGTDAGLSKFDGSRLSDQLEIGCDLPDCRVWDMVAGRQKQLWCSGNRTIFCWDGTSFNVIRAGEILHCSGRVLCHDSAGRIWALASSGARSTVLVYEEGGRQVWTRETSTPVNHVSYHQSNQIWLAGDSTLTQVELNRKQIIAGDCSAVAVAGDDSVWHATKLDGEQFLLRHTRSGEFNMPEQHPCPYHIVSLLAHHQRSGDLWIGTERHGLLLFNGESFVLPQGNQPTASMDWPRRTRVNRLMYSSDDRLWCATNRGLFVIDGDQVVDKYDFDLPTLRIADMDEMRDRRMVCASAGGLVFINPSNGRVSSVGADELGLPNGVVTAVRSVEANKIEWIWIGTDSGLYRCRLAEGTRVQPFPKSCAIKSRIHGIHPDPSGAIWLTTDVGLTKIDPLAEVHHTTHRGSDSQALAAAASIAFASDGSTWIGSSNGVAKFNRSLLSARPKLTFEGPTSGAWTARSGTVRCTTESERLGFRFRTVGVNAEPDEITYRYRIGVGDQWRLLRDDNIVQHESPRPGKYVLQVMAYDRDLNASNMIRVPYHVTPPYARWIWNGVAVFSLVSCGVFGLLLLRRVRRANRRLLERARQRSAEAMSAQQEQKRLHAELMHAQKMESLGTLAAGMAHDFNNALCAIASNAELGLMRIHDVQRVQESLREVAATAQQASGLTRSLLTFAGKSTTSVKPIPLQQVIQEVIAMVRGTMPAAIKINVSMPKQDIWCKADAGQINQVLMNLIINARDAISRHGTIKVDLCSAGISDSTARLRVIDDGAGMDSETAKRVFEPFFTRKASGKGTGLGLSIVQSIVTAHGGRIRVQSVPRQGTTFEIQLPTCQPATKASAPVLESTGPLNQDRGFAIVADDEPRVRSILVDILEEIGLSAVGVSDGEELLELMQLKYPDVSLVVADIDMPKMDGLTALSEIRKIANDLPIIMITGMPSEISANAREGPTVFLRKPFRLHELLDSVRRLVAGSEVPESESISR